MNAKTYLAAAALLLSTMGSLHAQRVDLNQVPAAVRTAIEASREKGALKGIVRHVQQGRAIYEVEFERNNLPNPRLRLAEDGTIIEPVPAMAGTEESWLLAPGYLEGASFPLRSTITLNDLPKAVQEAARREAAGREIADIDQERWDGRNIYEIEFGQPGRNPQVHIAEDGTVVRGEGEKRGLKSLFLGTQMQDTPPAVQETIRRLMADREIIDIDKRGTKDRPIYRVMARRNGVSYEVLHITEEGKVVGGIPPNRG